MVANQNVVLILFPQIPKLQDLFPFQARDPPGGDTENSLEITIFFPAKKKTLFFLPRVRNVGRCGEECVTGKHGCVEGGGNGISVGTPGFSLNKKIQPLALSSPSLTTSKKIVLGHFSDRFQSTVEKK